MDLRALAWSMGMEDPRRGGKKKTNPNQNKKQPNSKSWRSSSSQGPENLGGSNSFRRGISGSQKTSADPKREMWTRVKQLPKLQQ